MSRAINSGFSSARAPGLDFLDSFRTLGDCGVEEPLEAPRSVNQSGDDADRSESNPADDVYRSRSNIAGLFLSLVES